MEVLFRKLGCCSGKEVSLFCSCLGMFINGHIIQMGVGEDNQHLWSDGRSQRSVLYVCHFKGQGL